MVAAGKKRNRRKWPVGWQQNLFPLVIVTAGPGFQGVFVYSPGPGPGNLIASISGHAGTDPFGNPYNQGMELHGLLTLLSLTTNLGIETAAGSLLVGTVGIPGSTRQLLTQLFSPVPGAELAAALQLGSQSEDGTIPASAVIQGYLRAFQGLAIGSGLATQTLVNGSTINTAGKTMQPVTAAASVTGIILQAGTFDGQVIALPSDAGAGVTITFAAAATSHVKTGVGTVIQPGSTLVLMWVASTALWYPVQ